MVPLCAYGLYQPITLRVSTSNNTPLVFRMNKLLFSSTYTASSSLWLFSKLFIASLCGCMLDVRIIFFLGRPRPRFFSVETVASFASFDSHPLIASLASIASLGSSIDAPDEIPTTLRPAILRFSVKIFCANNSYWPVRAFMVLKVSKTSISSEVYVVAVSIMMEPRRRVIF